MKFPISKELLAMTRLTRRGRLGAATSAIRKMLSLRAARLAQPGTAAPTLRTHAFSPAKPGRETAPAPERSTTVHTETIRRGSFLARTFTNAAGSRPYRLYVPAGYNGQAMPLVVMLHGCTQTPDDFAAGTRMNIAAEAAGCLVAYPGQTMSANQQKCWNWFNPADQVRDGGEPALIAGIVREIMDDYRVDPSRVYVGGLSAGGAAADVLAARYPDLFAAVGVHSGLACGVARDLASAFAAMQHGNSGQPERRSVAVPTIVFHGDRDGVVNPRNANAVVAQALPGEALRIETTEGQAPGGHRFTRTRHRQPDGGVFIEQWVVHGGGHAWFGGDPAGSYTDPSGPDATGEMLRFFLTHRQKID